MSTPPDDPGDNSMLVGRYRIYGEIAAGGMATLHIGRLIGPAGFSRTVAIKRLHPQFSKDPEFVAMLLDEARLAARIVHPNVVSTLDVVAKDGELFLVMDYVAGESLAQLLKKAWRTKQHPSPSVVVSLGTDLLMGLHAAHEAKSDGGRPLGIVHRDVSPQNLLVGADGVGRVVDFGVAKAMIRSTSTRDGKVKGKLAYMSPEQIQAGPVDHRSDVFSAGVVLWEALAGKRLFTRPDPGAIVAAILTDRVEPPSKLAPDVPEAVDRVVLKALEKHADARFGTAGEMAEALADALVPAGALRVGQWVRKAAGDALNARARRVADVESQSSNQIPVPMDGSDMEITLAAGATNQTVAAGATDHTASIPGVPKRSGTKPLLWLAGAAALFILLPVVWFLGRAAGGSTAAEAPKDEPGQALGGASVSVPAEPTPAPSVTATSPEPSAQAPAPSASVDPPPKPRVTAPKPVAKPAAAPKPAAQPKPIAKPKPSAKCDPPFTLDSKGEKVFKPECF